MAGLRALDVNEFDDPRAPVLGRLDLRGAIAQRADERACECAVKQLDLDCGAF